MADKTVEQRRENLSSYFDNGPGPAGVMLPPTVGFVGHDRTRKQNPAYSIGLQLPSSLIVKGGGPGPIYLVPKGMTAKGPAPQLYATLKSRTKVNENINIDTAGPAAYFPNINVNRRKPPAFSLSFRTPVNERGKASPGPIYQIPSTLGTKGITIKGKPKAEDTIFRSPGPIYDIVKPSVYKYKAGEVTIKGRWKPLQSQSCNAGPGTYNVRSSTFSVWRRPPAFSLGYRHSPFAGVLMTKCDKEDSVPPNVDDC